LPESFGIWHKTGAGDAAARDAAMDKEFLLQRSDAAAYSDGKGTLLNIEASEMQDATGAYSAFTLARAGLHDCSTTAKLGEDCALGAGKLLFWVGDSLVSISAKGNQGIHLSELRDLLATLPKPNGTKGAMPLLPERLPKAGLDRETIRYAVGPVTFAKLDSLVPASAIDFTKSPEIIRAHYFGKPGSGVLQIIYFPTPQIAAGRGRAIEAALKSNDAAAVKRVGPMVAVATGFTKKQAQAMVESVRYDAQVTFNHPEGYINPVQQTASVLVKIMLFVFLMTFAALILGIFFGGGRALIRKLQGKPLSSLDDMEVIRLNLGGKPSTKLQVTPSEGPQGSSQA
jgi:hypothetical protein